MALSWDETFSTFFSLLPFRTNRKNLSAFPTIRVLEGNIFGERTLLPREMAFSPILTSLKWSAPDPIEGALAALRNFYFRSPSVWQFATEWWRGDELSL